MSLAPFTCSTCLGVDEHRRGCPVMVGPALSKEDLRAYQRGYDNGRRAAIEVYGAELDRQERRFQERIPQLVERAKREVASEQGEKPDSTVTVNPHSTALLRAVIDELAQKVSAKRILVVLDDSLDLTTSVTTWPSTPLTGEEGEEA